ncbi:MAG TPA: M35 family metallo-endopeptidase [Acetobacteraceae bacterium]|nr:M35 family metallo-endopeptidase [Acetobacteraceae bacterium]
MYRIRYEGGVNSAEQQAIEQWVPKMLDTVVKAALSVGDGVITRWFGDDARPSGAAYGDFDGKRKKMSDYVLNRCQVITFVKKVYGKKVDGAEVEQGDFAQVIRSCFGADPSGFTPSGVRIYVLGSGLINQDAHERFNTITHELSHRVIGTTDAPGGKMVYGKRKALSLATKSSAEAVICAENWGYFYQEVLERMPA